MGICGVKDKKRKNKKEEDLNNKNGNNGEKIDNEINESNKKEKNINPPNNNIEPQDYIEEILKSNVPTEILFNQNFKKENGQTNQNNISLNNNQNSNTNSSKIKGSLREKIEEQNKINGLNGQNINPIKSENINGSQKLYGHSPNQQEFINNISKKNIFESADNPNARGTQKFINTPICSLENFSYNNRNDIHNEISQNRKFINQPSDQIDNRLNKSDDFIEDEPINSNKVSKIINNPSDNGQNNPKLSDLKITENKENKKLPNYQDFNINSKYYLVCPVCEICIPYIETIEYDTEEKDFKVEYKCPCINSDMKTKEAYFRELLIDYEPRNFCPIHEQAVLQYFCNDCKIQICGNCKDEQHQNHNIRNNNIIISEENAKKMLDIALQEKEEFKGVELIQKLYQTNLVKHSVNINSENINLNQDNCEDLNQESQIFNGVQNNINNIRNLNSNIIDNNFDEPHTFIINDENKSHDNDEFKKDFQNEVINGNFNNQSFINNNEETNYMNLKVSKQNNNNIPSSNLNEQNNKIYKNTLTLEGHTDKVVSLIQLESGYIATGSYDFSIRIWDLNQGKCIKSFFEGGYVFCLLEFEKDILLTGTSENKIGLWNLNNINDYVYRFERHQLWVNCLVKCNENHFASAANDAIIYLWDFNNRNCIGELLGHLDCILCLIMLNNGYLCSGSADKTIKIWDWKNQKIVMELKSHDKWVKCLCQLKDDTILSGSDDKSIKVWANFSNTYTLTGHEHSVRTICEIDENTFASGSFDHTIKIWNSKTMNNISTLTGHDSNVICIIKLKDNRLASCSSDKTIKIWE